MSAVGMGAVGTGAGPLFVPLRPAWILHEDDDLLVMNKPAGVPSQSADPAHPDDLPHRARLYFAARGEPQYLGIHQRLDRDTSGVVLYARRREANPSLAQQFEGRSVQKEYVAVVTGYRGGDRVLRHFLTPQQSGVVSVTNRSDRRGREAVTRVRVVAQRGERALLALRIETGRTHQIRAQLAAEGAPVLGDPLYGGAPSGRLMLHAAALGLAHPRTGTPVRFESPTPPALRAALEGRDGVALDDRDGLREAVRTAIDRRFGLAARLAAGGAPFAMRLLHRGSDGVPDLAVDLYHRHLVAHLYAPKIEAHTAAVVDVLAELGAEGLYLKHRPKRAQVVGAKGHDEWAPSTPAWGVPAPSPLTIIENDVPYPVRLDEGLSTGIFLDQRDNRARVREAAASARVLNLFAYTCGFSLAAALGGARSTVSVDASGAALAWGEESFRRAGAMADVGGGDHEFVKADVFEALEAFARAGRTFDLLILDPPTFSTTRRHRWASGAGWEGLVEQVVRVAAKSAVLLLSSNDHRMSTAQFRRFVHRGVERGGRRVDRLRDLPPPSDFPPASGHPAHLKSAWLSIR